MKNVSLVAAWVALGASLAAADEIQLTNGHKIVGVRRTDPKQTGKVIVEVGAGTIVLDAQQVSAVTPGRTPLHDYEDKWKAVQNSSKASDFWDLAQWCRQNKVTRHTEMLCKKAISIEADHEGAHKMLGHAKVGGKWLTFDEAQAAKGLVKVGDRWVTKAEKELMEKHALEVKEREMAAKMEREIQKEEERRRRQQAMDDYNSWFAHQMAQLDGYFYQPDWCWPAYFRPYPWASYQRSRRYYQSGWMYEGGGLPYLDITRFLRPATSTPGTLRVLR